MDTPLYDFLKNYNDSNTVRCHMPGHKGKSFFGGLNELYGLDITEIQGADSLFEADGIILESEKNMSRLYNTKSTFYSAGGSTLCIQAMLAAMKIENRVIIAVRNVHRAFLNACVLLDIEIKWIIPEYSGSILSGEINLAEIENVLKNTENACFYVTSPDYTGKLADIKRLSELCDKYNAVLIVDNAHGSHLNFLSPNLHPIALGANICCDSAHKMLPALTGSAMLHTSSEKYAKILRQCMSMFASTSPSYLIMLSLDLCTKYISESIHNDIEENLKLIADFRNRFRNRVKIADTEPFHITLQALESGYNGNELAESLRQKGVECEHSDNELLILLMSPMNTAEDYARLSNALEYALENTPKHQIKTTDFKFRLPEKAMSIRNAVFSPCEEISIEKAEGRICGAVKVPCPPAVPIVASGEIIDKNSINIFKNYGISSVIVVK